MRLQGALSIHTASKSSHIPDCNNATVPRQVHLYGNGYKGTTGCEKTERTGITSLPCLGIPWKTRISLINPSWIQVNGQTRW